jgi:hypothetical protein
MKSKRKTWVTAFVERAKGVMRGGPAGAVHPEEARPFSVIPTYGGVYFIQTDGKHGPIKIGISQNIKHRFEQIQTHHPEPLRLVNHEPIDDESERITREAELHEFFKYSRLKGEWFNARAILKYLARED